MRTGVSGVFIGTEAQIAAGVITTQSLDLSTINQHYLFATASTCDIGSLLKPLRKIFADDAGGGLKALLLMAME